MNDIWNITTTELPPAVEVTYKYEYHQGYLTDASLDKKLLWVNENNHVIHTFNVTVHPHGFTTWHMLVHVMHEEPVAEPTDPEDEFNDYEEER